MKIYTKLTNIKREHYPLALALGMFDGVHIGHQSIVRRAVELAASGGGKAAVLTFSNHPLSVLSPHSMPKQIGSPRLKAAILAEMGVDVLFNLPFTREFSKVPPERFLEMLRDNLSPRYLVTGANFTFGREGKGNGRMLLRLGEEYGFTAEICPTVLLGGKAVSSTRVRSLIAAGDLSMVNEFLGRPFSFMGRVVHGDRRGRTLGFPTANLSVGEDRAMLPNGAYAAEVRLRGDRAKYLGLVSVGSNPTFGERERRLEVNIQDFNADIYNELIEVRFWQRLRDERKFPSAEHLVRQLNKDRAAARIIWQKYGG